MIDVKSAKEIEIMQEGGQILASVLQAVAREIKPGIATAELDQLAEKLVRQAGAEPSFLHHENYPASLCVSVNQEVVHGIPKPDKIIRGGDLVKIDFGVKYQGMFTDSALTVTVGEISPRQQKLVETTEQALAKAIAVLQPGVKVGDISSTIQKYVESRGFSVVRKLVGHGVGRAVHEDPRIPNFGRKGTGPELPEGACIAIEPMVIDGGPEVVVADDGWTYSSADNGLTAHFEKTIAIVKSGYQVLT